MLTSARDRLLLESSGGVLTIDLRALQSNYATLCRAAAPSKCAAVVKADAYGLGAIPVSQALYRAGCRDFFVAHLVEGIDLRPKLPVGTAIYILNGLQKGCEEVCADHALIPVLNSLDQVERWATIQPERPEHAPAVLQIDTGMSRLGLSVSDVATLLQQPEKIARLNTSS